MNERSWVGGGTGAPKFDGMPVARPRQRMTSREVAAAAGVSQSTVSNVLNRPHLVAPETLARVTAVMESSGFIVNRSARTLRAGKSSTLGVLVLDVANPYWGEMVRGIEAVADQSAHAVIVCSSDESPQKEDRCLRLLEEQQVRGVLVAPVRVDSPTLDGMFSRGTDVVLIDRIDPTNRFPSVAVDHVYGASLAGAHLIEIGHRQVAFVNGPRSVSWCRDRAAGFMATFEAAGLDPATAVREVTVPAMTARNGETSVEQIVHLEPDVTAVFCANDLLALGVLKGLSTRGIAVPGDISLIGYDDDDFAELLSPRLTTVRQNPYEMGQRGAKLILDGAARDGGQSVLFPPLLIQRDSVASVTV